MSDPIDDGGEAFPRPLSSIGDQENFVPRVSEEQHGMSLRDYFAGQIVTGLISDGTTWTNDSFAAKLAKDTYRLADAMIEARKPKGAP